MSQLEGVFSTNSECRRVLEDQSRTVERIRDRRNAGNTAVDRKRLIKRNGALRIGYVEPIGREPKLLRLRELDRIIKSEVKVPGRRGTVVADSAGHACGVDTKIRNDRCSARNTKSFVVAIDR